MRLWIFVVFAAVLTWAVCIADDTPVAAVLSLQKCDVVKHRLAEAGSVATLEQAVSRAQNVLNERNATLVARSKDVISQDQQIAQRTLEVTTTAAKPQAPARDREVKRLTQVRRDLQISRDKMFDAQEEAQRAFTAAQCELTKQQQALSAKRGELVAFARRSPTPWLLAALVPRKGASPYPPSGEAYGPSQGAIETLPGIAERWPSCEADTADGRRALWQRLWAQHGPGASGYKASEYFKKSLDLLSQHSNLCAQVPPPPGVAIDDRTGECRIDLKWNDRVAIYMR